MKIPKVLVIAGSDSCGGAGLQADLKVIALHNVYAGGVLSCLTAQNTQRVFAIHEIPSEFLRQQISAVLEDIDFDVVKIGMLASQEIIEVIVDELFKKTNNIPIILDPVMVATSGDVLLKNNAIEALKNKLLKRSFLVTPNIDEAQILSEMKINNLDDMYESAKIIKSLGVKAVLIKGGHLNFADNKIHNLLLDEENKIHIISNEKIAVEKIHGSGCSLASAISANIAKKISLVLACQKANEFIFRAIKNFQKVGKGSNVLGLINENLL
jgi:hydroxymethylpyrimidine/phosphomethylpyrimidine kinase